MREKTSSPIKIGRRTKPTISSRHTERKPKKRAIRHTGLLVTPPRHISAFTRGNKELTQAKRTPGFRALRENRERTEQRRPIKFSRTARTSLCSRVSREQSTARSLHASCCCNGRTRRQGYSDRSHPSSGRRLSTSSDKNSGVSRKIVCVPELSDQQSASALSVSARSKLSDTEGRCT